MTIGPFDSERQARKAAHEIVQPGPDSPVLSQTQNAALLTVTAMDAGVHFGDYDVRIAAWLSGFTDASCAVVAGWISRAYEAGKRDRT